MTRRDTVTQVRPRYGTVPDQAWPLVSVVIPVRDSRATLARALRSVVQQKYSPLEVIVVDDGSIDDIADILVEFSHLGPTLKRLETSQGAAAARNVGISLASGEFVAFLDADDEWLPGKTTRQVQALIDDPLLAFAYSAALSATPGRADRMLTEVVDARAFGDAAWKVLLKHGCVVTSSVVARRNLICEVGGFDQRLLIAEDQDLWIRLALRGRVHHEARPLLRKYRIESSLSVVHRHRIASVTLPMIEAHVAALEQRLTPAEKASILAYRRLVAGRNCYESGRTLQGLRLVLSATWQGGHVVQNLLYLLSASPAARLVKRFAGLARADAPSRLPLPT